MRVFWWQGGLHLDPETAEEGKALQVLCDSSYRTTIGADGNPDEPKDAQGHRTLSRSCVVEQPPELFIADQ